MTALYARGYFALLAHQKRYFVQSSLFLSAVYWVILSNDLLSLYLGWEWVGCLSALLTAFWYQTEHTLVASRYVLLVNKIGSLCFLLALIILLRHLGDVSWITIKTYYAYPHNTLPAWYSLAQTLICIALLTKLAQFPFFTWLPKAMVAPIPVSVLLHTATVLAIGIYLLIQLHSSWPPYLLNALVVVGYLTALVASTAAWAQDQVKPLLAYSTIIHLGYMVILIAFGNLAEALLHFLVHTIVKVCLFFCLGTIQQSPQGVDVFSSSAGNIAFQRLYKSYPLVWVAYLAATVVLYCLPVSELLSPEKKLLLGTYSWFTRLLNLAETPYGAYGWFFIFMLFHSLGAASLCKAFFLLAKEFPIIGAVKHWAHQHSVGGRKYIRLALLLSMIPVGLVCFPFFQLHLSNCIPSMSTVVGGPVKGATYPTIFSFWHLTNQVSLLTLVVLLYSMFKKRTDENKPYAFFKNGWYVAELTMSLSNRLVACIGWANKLENLLLRFIQLTTLCLFLLTDRLSWIEHQLFPTLVHKVLYVFDWASKQYRALQCLPLQYHLVWIICVILTVIGSMWMAV